MFEARKLCALVLGSILFSFSFSWAGDARAPEEQKKAELFVKGAQLWPNYCGNCHNPRGPSDRSPVDWDLVMMHMRSIANIPATDTEAIVEFLKKR